MPKIEFTQEEINNFVKEKIKHPFYERSVKIDQHMKVHADGEFPKELIEERRPSEPLEVKAYREKIWVPVTKPTISKVFSSLQKIRRSSDWSIKYENQEEFTKINETETLEQYCEFNFPYFTSFTNWVFTIQLRKQLIGPNAVVFVFPLETDVKENEYLRPFPVIFSSKDVIYHVQEDYIVLNNPMGAIYYSSGKPIQGKSFYIVTTQQVLKYDQVDGRMNFALSMQYDHELGILPAFSLKGVLIDQTDNHFLYESRLAGMLPELDEAVREYSDLQAAKVTHIYPERWEFTNNECAQCKGTGKRPNPNFFVGCAADVQATVDCGACHNGYTVPGPYSKIMIRPVSSLEPGGQIPTPPAGFVEKDVEIVKVMDESVKNHKFEALAAINFQFLEDTPMNESGKAKEVDKDELNNTVHSIAEDVVAAMDNYYKIAARYRYKGLYSFEEIDRMLPKIPVPEKYDLLSPQHTEEELKNAKTNKTNPVIVNALEVDYASKRFGNDPEVRDRLGLILELDPLPNVSEDDKMSRLSNKGITQETYVISSNIQEFVQTAIDDDPTFPDKPLKEQKDKMKSLAADLIKQNSASAQAIKVNTSGNGLEDEDTENVEVENGGGLSEEMIVKIKSLRQQGSKYKDIERLTGVPLGTISSILNG